MCKCPEKPTPPFCRTTLSSSAAAACTSETGTLAQWGECELVDYDNDSTTSAPTLPATTILRRKMKRRRRRRRRRKRTTTTTTTSRKPPIVGHSTKPTTKGESALELLRRMNQQPPQPFQYQVMQQQQPFYSVFGNNQQWVYQLIHSEKWRRH
jgi:hypothetical protein